MKKTRPIERYAESGYVTLILVILVGAFTAAVVLRALSDGVTSSETGASFLAASRARSYADACAERALYRVHAGDVPTPGSDSGELTLERGTCTYAATTSGGGGVTIDAVGHSGRANVSLGVSGSVTSGNVTVTAWQ